MLWVLFLIKFQITSSSKAKINKLELTSRRKKTKKHQKSQKRTKTIWKVKLSQMIMMKRKKILMIMMNLV
jgi:hypothetical protein